MRSCNFKTSCNFHTKSGQAMHRHLSPVTLQRSKTSCLVPMFFGLRLSLCGSRRMALFGGDPRQTHQVHLFHLQFHVKIRLNVLNTMRALRTESKGLNAFVSQARLRRSKRSSDIKCISKYTKKFGDQQRSCMFDHSMLRNFPKTFAKVFKSVQKTFLVGQFWSVYLGRVCCSPGPTSFWSLWRSCAG